MEHSMIGQRVTMNDGYRIYFASVILARGIYQFGNGQGFSDHVSMYALATSEDHARTVIEEHLEADGKAVSAIQLGMAKCQDPNRFLSRKGLAGFADATRREAS